ncbi:thiamine pyrophosphokinase [Kozakia baliensis]|nr:thiamine pyrophosphokinase [Kozakia baliensis]
MSIMNDSNLAPFLQHIAHCHTARLPGTRRPFYCEHMQIGWVDPRIFLALGELRLETGDGFGVPHGSDLQNLGAELARRELYRPHHELFDVSTLDNRVLGQIDRGALPLLGLTAQGVHLNGLVRKESGLFIWLGHRSLHKRLDPGKLDHLVAGGVCAGIGPLEALAKEAEEEASIKADLIAQAKPVATIRYAMERPEGLRRDTLHCYNLYLPESFVPEPADGEVEFFKLLPIEEVFSLVRDTQKVKFNVNLVLIDLFLRQNLFSPSDAAILRAALNAS